MDEMIVCQCLWPLVICETTITGHDVLCPVERQGMEENQVEAARLWYEMKERQAQGNLEEPR